jgi:hypothetical protein
VISYCLGQLLDNVALRAALQSIMFSYRLHKILDNAFRRS